MRELTGDELKAVSGGLSAVRAPAHPLLLLLVAVVLKALGISLRRPMPEPKAV